VLNAVLGFSDSHYPICCVGLESPRAPLISQKPLEDTFLWFREDGLLAQHARLYPESRLTIVLRPLWGTPWVLVAFWILAR
jgi:hypothetical protein